MEKKKVNEIECPLCEGTGLVVRWALIKNTAKIRIAHALSAYFDTREGAQKSVVKEANELYNERE